MFLLRNLELRFTFEEGRPWAGRLSKPQLFFITSLHHENFPADIFDVILSTCPSVPGPEQGLAPHPNLTSGFNRVRLERLNLNVTTRTGNHQ
jgi:hypothetical protein